jgi:hypothetical protein
MSKSSRVSILSVTTNNPSANTIVDVMSIGGNMGQLCKCNGTVLPVGVSFDGIYLKIGTNGQTFTPAQVVAAPDAVISASEIYPSGSTGVAANWNRDTRMQSSCGPAGSEPSNTLFVASRCFDFTPSPPHYVEVLEPSNTPFKGKAVNACAAIARRNSLAKSEIPTTDAGEGVPASPIDSDGDWLLYGGLSVSNHYYGNRLMRNGNPLRARVLAIAAADVNWSHDLASGSRWNVRRPAGDMAFEPLRPSPWRFPNAPTNSLVVWQKQAGLPERVLSSECREQPDLVHVDPDEDLFVQVNYHAVFQRTLRGAFGLWVKAID